MSVVNRLYLFVQTVEQLQKVYPMNNTWVLDGFLDELEEHHIPAHQLNIFEKPDDILIGPAL